MKQWSTLCIALFLFVTLKLSAQPLGMHRGDTIPVFSGNRQLSYPWAGGHNNCQFSEMDFDGDGINDLFVFDRTGNRVTTFKNLGTPNTVDFVYAPQYQSAFPRLYDWALLRDYNYDGKMDIMTGRWGGLGIYKNITVGSGPTQFHMVADTVHSTVNPTTNPQQQIIFINSIDVPSIRDVDGDGDLDIVSFHSTGLQIDFHRNKSMELYGIPDSIVYENTTRCFGYIYENAGNPTLSLNANCGDPAQRPVSTTQNPMHSGSCTECFDIDADGDLDLLIGDISADAIQLARNGGTAASAMFDSVDTHYPSYDTPVNTTVFPCGFSVDVDNDGAKDLVVSPNSPFTSENFKSIWYYHNIGRTDSVRLQYVQNNFIQNNEIEVGDGAYPVFFDYNNDGKEDLFIGNYGAYTNSVFTGKIELLQNIGTSTSPVFKILNQDFAGLGANNTGILNPMPAFGDLDNDGDKDMLVGASDGKLYYFEKQPGNDDNFVLTIPAFQGIDVGNYAAPILVDMNNDGLLDLVIGEQNGNLNYYQNSGTASAPVFTLTNGFFGGVDVRQPNYITGYSTPFIFKDNGHTKLVVGCENSWVHVYDSIDGNLGGNFHLVDTSLFDVREGLRTAPTAYDLNGDSLLDFVIGNYSGGVALFMGDNSVGIAPVKPETDLYFTVSPNPASQQFTLVLPESTGNETPYFTLNDISGRLLVQQTVHSGRTNIDIQNLPSGVYFCTVICGSKSGHRKLVIQR